MRIDNCNKQVSTIYTNGFGMTFPPISTLVGGLSAKGFPSAAIGLRIVASSPFCLAAKGFHPGRGSGFFSGCRSTGANTSNPEFGAGSGLGAGGLPPTRLNGFPQFAANGFPRGDERAGAR